MEQHLGALMMHIVTRAGLAGLFFVMVLGNIAVPIGSEVLLPIVGALIATGHLSSGLFAPLGMWQPLADVALATLVAVAGELVGGLLLYSLGRYGGAPAVTVVGRFLHLSDAALAGLEHYYARFGAPTVFVSRLIPLVRGIAALPAGLSAMPLIGFLCYTLLGSLLFCGALITVGWHLGPSIVAWSPLLQRAGLLAPALAVLLLILALVAGRFLHRVMWRPVVDEAAPPSS